LVLKVDSLFAPIGGSVGGGIAWEILALEPKLAQNFIPIATDWKSTDWIANCYLQEKILNNSSKLSKMPVFMPCFATEHLSLSKSNSIEIEQLETFKVESWLNYHGEKLEKRFQLSAYKMMNQLLKND
jgi:homoserine acetyltransferase